MYSRSPLSLYTIYLLHILSAFNECSASEIPRETGAITIQGRTPPPATTITVAPQTALITGAVATTYLAYSGQTDNSKVTQTIDGTPTILPIWYCDPTLSAPACSGCPTSTTSGQQPCPTDFNYLLLMPLVAVIGGIVPPPPGLPTLSINSDGNVDTPSTLLTPSPTTSTPPAEENSTSSNSSISVSVSCTSPTIVGARDAASVASSPPPWIPPTGSPAPSLTEVLPILPLTNADPAHPTIWAGCGTGISPYYSGGFFQFSNTFSRNAGMDAVGKFCQELIASQVVIGPSTETYSNLPQKTPFPMIVKSYDESDGSGKVQLRVQTSIDYCEMDPARSNSDITWKSGGTVYTNCFYYSVQKFPTGGDPDTKF